MDEDVNQIGRTLSTGTQRTDHRPAAMSWLAFIATVILSTILVSANWGTEQRPVTIAVAACAMSTALAAVTGRPVLKGVAALTLVGMTVVTLTHPTGAVNAWVVVAVLGFFFAVIRRPRQHTRG